MNDFDFDVIVAGGGVAGLSAAVFLGRAQVRTALFDQAESSLYRVSRVNNYLGFPDGIGGRELLELGKRQAQHAGATLFPFSVAAVAMSADGFEVTADGKAYRAAYFVIASNKRTDLATSLGISLGGHGSRFVAVDASGQTAVANCYGVGRITGLPSQAIISAGNGAHVALAIIQRIRGAYYVDHDV